MGTQLTGKTALLTAGIYLITAILPGTGTTFAIRLKGVNVSGEVTQTYTNTSSAAWVLPVAENSQIYLESASSSSVSFSDKSKSYVRATKIHI